MQNLTAFIKRAKKWTPEQRYAQKLAIQDKKKGLEIKRRDIQSQIDGLAIQLDALYTIDSDKDLPETNDYKPRVHVTDHAIVRYIDRVLKFDTDLIRKEFIKMMPDKITRNAQTVTADNMIYQLVWLPNQVVVKTFYKRKSRKTGVSA
jgi:hypothetical protein